MRDEFISSFIGKTLEVQFEQRRSDGLFEGKTTNYITVAAPSDENIQGKYFNVLITGFGALCPNPQMLYLRFC